MKAQKILGGILAIALVAQGVCENQYLTVMAEENTSFRVEYKLDGGENDERNPSKYEQGVGIDHLYEPYRFEHDFEGWYLDGAYQIPADGIDETSTGDVVLYAKWKMYDYDYTINYNTHYGYNGKHNPSGYYEGVGVRNLEDASRVGYTFQGWFLKNVEHPFTKQIYSISETEKGTISLEAKFEPNVYRIAYYLNGGNFIQDNEPPKEYTYGEKLNEFPEPVQRGMRFTGWYTDEECTQKFTGIKEDTIDNLTLYAGWKEVKVSDFELDKVTLELTEGAEDFLKVGEIFPSDALDKQVYFSSENEEVARVDEDGNIQAVSPGNTRICVKVGDVEKFCEITVKAIPTPTLEPTATPTITLTPTPTITKKVYKVSFVPSKYSVKTTKVLATKLIIDKDDAVKSYTSSNKTVATVNSKGVVYGVNTGTAIITVETKKGAKAQCKVTVSKNVVKTQKITLKNIKKSKVSVKRKGTFTIKAVISPKNSTQKLSYVTSNKKIATVSAKGKITGKKKGNCVVTVKSGSKSKKILVTVK